LCGREANFQLPVTPAPASAVAPGLAQSPLSPPAYSPGLFGVRGWLLVFCVITTILTPLGNLRSLALTFPGPWGAYYLAVIAFSMAVGIKVWRIAPDALTWVRAYFISFATWEVLRITYVVTIYPRREFDLQMASRVRTLIWVAIWTSYFLKSERVRATFGRNL
jgi:hypothetical protein